MGCGASSEDKRDGSVSKYRSPNTPGGTNSDAEHSIDGRSGSVVSNNFTTTYATGSKRSTVKYEPAYKPGSSEEDAEAEFERWKNKNRLKTAHASDKESPFLKPEKIVEDFVFGDFKIDPMDVQQQRIERFNRVRKPGDSATASTSLPRRTASMNSMSRRKSFGTFVMNDFAVKTVDEGDDPIYYFLHEVKVPPGFHQLQRYTFTQLHSHPCRVKVVAISPSETEFVSASTEDQSLSMFSLESHEETSAFVGHSAPIVAAVFSRDGKYLATSSRDNTVIVWDTMHKDNAKRVVRTLDHPCLPICIEFSNDSKFLISGCQDKLCRVWDIEKSTVAITFNEHEGVVVCASAHPKRPVAISGGGDRVLRMWDVNTAVAIQQFIGHDGIIISVTFTPDGDRILSNDDRACKMWNAETGACLLNVTLQSLTAGLGNSEFPPPMPLPRSFLDRVPLTSKQLGYAPNGILGPQATNACKIGTNRSVFTLSCLLPGSLSRSYFAVACTNKTVYIVSCATGREEASIAAKAAVFALSVGREETLIFGDVFGNVTKVNLVAKQGS